MMVKYKEPYSQQKTPNIPPGSTGALIDQMEAKLHQPILKTVYA
jgi:hypothetical protein